MVGQRHSEINIEASASEGDVEELMGGNIGGAKKWTVAEDQQLIQAWVNVRTDSIVEADKKKSSF